MGYLVQLRRIGGEEKQKIHEKTRIEIGVFRWVWKKDMVGSGRGISRD